MVVLRLFQFAIRINGNPVTERRHAVWAVFVGSPTQESFKKETRLQKI